MSISQCKRCSKLYAKIKAPYCPECIDEIDRQFKIVRDYMMDHPGAEINTILEETKVEEKLLFYLLREGRLSFIRNSGLNCQKCGVQVPSGRFCNACNAKLKSDFSILEDRLSQDVQAEKQETEKSNKRSGDSGIHISVDKGRRRL